MSLPIIEQIALVIVERLQRISKADDYHDDVVGVVRPTKLGGFTPEHRLIVVEQGDAEDPPDAESTEGNPLLKEVNQPWYLKLFVRPSDSDTTPVDTLVNLFVADVIQALTDTDDNAWYQWDGLALNSSWKHPVSFVATKGSCEGAMIELTVHYRTPDNDLHTT